MFGRAAFEEAQQWFRYLLITSEQEAKDKPKHVSSAVLVMYAASDVTPGLSRAMLRCCSRSRRRWVQALQFLFALPPGHSPALLNHMLGLVMVYIDLLGGYKLGPEQKKRSEKVRVSALSAVKPWGPGASCQVLDLG